MLGGLKESNPKSGLGDQIGLRIYLFLGISPTAVLKLKLLAPTMDICKVSNPEQKEIGLFGLQSSLTSRHVCGHVTRATCILRAPVTPFHNISSPASKLKFHPLMYLIS